VTPFHKQPKEGSEGIVVMIVNRKHTGREEKDKRMKKRTIIISNLS